MTNAAHVLWAQADTQPDALALRDESHSWTYREVCDNSAAFAAKLQKAGVQAGDRIVLVAPTSAAFVFAYYGIISHGAVAVTVNTMCTEPELAYFIEDSGSSIVVAWHETDSAARAASAVAGVKCWSLTADEFDADEAKAESGDVAVRDGDDPAVLLYTSGTTGKPKGAVLTHNNIGTAVTSFAESLNLDPGERLGTALPLFHVFGQVAVLAMAFHVGCSLSLLRPFSGAAMVAMAAEHRLTVLSGVPTMWIEMMSSIGDAPLPDLSELRLVRSGGAVLPMEVSREFERLFGVTVLDGYGLSETTGAGTFSSPERPYKEGSVGQALPGVAVAVLDERGKAVDPGVIGEVAVSGANVMQQYLNRPDATAVAKRDGWFRTGDLGRMDEDGYLWIVDRMKDLVIRGGYNVYPREIEEALYEHPAVREAAVIGVPNHRLGEEVAAVISLRAGVELDVDELRPWLSERLAAYKVPRLYLVVDRLPTGPTGKILKRAINPEDVNASARRVPQPSVPTATIAPIT